MLVTSREQKLIDAFVKQGVLSISEMLELTETSRRTLYRDLDKLQASLPLGVDLRTSDEGYYLSGDLASLSEEAQKIVEFTVTERLYGELLLLIDNQASINSLTEKFDISQPTATSDLRIIDQTLQENSLILDRERGLNIVGKEEAIRSALASVINATSSIIEILSGEFEKNKVLSLLDLTAFDEAKWAFDHTELPEMTDKTHVLMQIFLTTSLLRLKQGRSIKSDNIRRPSKNALNFVNLLIGNLSKVTFTIAEIIYLASVYDVLYFGFGREVLFMEKFDTEFSYKIRRLIEGVSEKLEIEFSKDDRLYGLLYAHLKGTDILPQLFSEKKNDFIKKIEKDNEKIFRIVQETLPEVFDKKFSDMENAFVTLHFVATLERSDLVLPLQVALVTSRGRISCEFLMSNLRKNFPFLKKIDLIQTSVKFDQSHYDAVFTTEKELDYIFVSRTMDRKNLDDIRHKLREIQQNTRRINESDQPNNLINLNQLFSIGNSILSEFKIVEMDNQTTLTEVVNQIVNVVNFDEKESLSKLLKTRFEDTHLAIPDTRLALLHGVHRSVKYPLFQIFDLSKEIEVTAMNRKKMKVKRILLLLSPPEIADYAAYLLGKISSSIIENKLYTTIYDSGNYAVVNELLKQIITESIRKYGAE